MAVVADRLRQAAQARKEKVPVLAPTEIERFSTVFVPFKEVREIKPNGEPGRLIKAVAYLDCHAQVKGMGSGIHRQIDIEVGEGWGVFGEIEQGVSIALREFLEFVKSEWLATQDRKVAEALEAAGGLRPLPSDRGKDPRKVEWMKSLNARKVKERQEREEAEKLTGAGGGAEGAAQAQTEPAQEVTDNG